MAAPKRQLCPRGHDTFAIARDPSGRCLRCKRDDLATSRSARLAEAWAAQSARIRKEQDRRDRERAREGERVLKAGGEPALSLTLEEAGQELLLGLEREPAGHLRPQERTRLGRLLPQAQPRARAGAGAALRP
jgi:hypothetical protein